MKRAFTLIEILIVIAILFPVSAQANAAKGETKEPSLVRHNASLNYGSTDGHSKRPIWGHKGGGR